MERQMGKVTMVIPARKARAVGARKLQNPRLPSTKQAKEQAELAEILDRLDRGIATANARADRLLEMYGLR